MEHRYHGWYMYRNTHIGDRPLSLGGSDTVFKTEEYTEDDQEALAVNKIYSNINPGPELNYTQEL